MGHSGWRRGVGPVAAKPIGAADTCDCQPCRSAQDARLLLALLNAEVAKGFLRSFVFACSGRSPHRPTAGRAGLRRLAQELKTRAVVAEISYATVRRGYPPVRASALVAPMAAAPAPYDARYPVLCRDEPPKQRLSATRTPRPARPGQPAACDYAYVRRGACALWLFAEPLGQGRTANAGARPWIGRARRRPWWSPALPSGRMPDLGLRQPERPSYRLFLRRVPARRHAPPGAARTSGVYAPARQRVPQGRTGTERPDAPSPAPAQGSAWAEARHAAPDGHRLAVPHRRRPRPSQEVMPNN